MSLFGGAASQTRSRNLVEFKAGKMNLRGTMVHPDKRKGLVYLYQGNDMLMHFCWKERSSSTPEDDLVIFPDEIEFKKVTQNTTGRVFILKWRNSPGKLFFWMQEPKDDKDEEWCKKINDLLNHPPTPGFGDDSSGASGGAHPLQSLMDRMAGSGGAGGIDPNDLSNVLRGMNPNDLASLLSSVGSGGAPGLMQGSHRGRVLPSTSTQPATSLLDAFSQSTSDSRPNTAPAGTRTTGAAAAAAGATGTTSTSTNRPSGTSSKPRNTGTSSSTAAAAATTAAAAPKSGAQTGSTGGPKGGPIQMSALSNILANLSDKTTTQDASGVAAAAGSKSSIDLYDIMTTENLIPILSNKDIQESLKAHLPDGSLISGTEKELRESIQSPQFRQAVGTFSVALQTGQLGPVLAQFGLPEDAISAANEGDIQAFAQAMEKYYKKTNAGADEKQSSDSTMDTS